MTHIPTIKSINAWCPACKIRFAPVVENRQVVCPGCRFVQIMPIIYMDQGEFYCLDCKVTFTSAPRSKPRCHECLAYLQTPLE